MNKYSRKTKTLPFMLALGIAMGLPYSLAGQALSRDDTEPDFVPNELIILLDHGAGVPAPEGVVDAIKRRQQAPDGLGVGNPIASRFVISDRATRAAKALLDERPDAPDSLLQRYIVLTYPPVVDLDRIAQALERNPNVLWVGKNWLAELSVTEPNDPFFDNNPSGVLRAPEEHQWGSYSLHLPEAWDYSKGHSYVALVDTGIDTDHPDLRPFDDSGNFIGGNFRAHLSWDYGYDDDDVDEGQTQGSLTVLHAGHGTHVAGIVGATANNSIGVAGACWNCSLLISKVSIIRPGPDGYNVRLAKQEIIDGIHGAIGRGAQVLNLSGGFRPGGLDWRGEEGYPDCATTPLDCFCKALELLESRDTVMTAAAGNNGGQASDFPAVDSRVIGVGGIEPDGSFWNDCPGTECGSNVNSNQIVTPAKQVYSTFYEGLPYIPDLGCSDSVDGTEDGYGLCTGTSMSSPYAAGVAGILRSINPLLTKSNIRSLLTSNLENPVGWNLAHGIGKPNALAAVQAALGNVNNVVLTNRLTPLFPLYSSVAEDYFYTTVPQMASAAYWSSDGYFSGKATGGAWPDVPGYGYFPDTDWIISPSPPEPGASVYVFTTDRSPSATVPLVPLYRMSFEGPVPGGTSNPNNRDHTYTTNAAGIEDFADLGYRLDGIEGYIYKRCTPDPSCIPAGAVRLYRYYNADLDDWALFPESELSDWQDNGYAAQPGYNEWIGYVYPNLDSDSDSVIDGFEALMGTKPQRADSDCDGLSDGTEVLDYPYADPGGPDHLNLANQTIATTHLFSACRTLTASTNFVVGSGGNVTLHAVDWVALGPGFGISKGGQLKVVVP